MGQACVQEGTFHADPHPGNALIHISDVAKLVLLDWGCVVSLEPQELKGSIARILLFDFDR